MLALPQTLTQVQAMHCLQELRDALAAQRETEVVVDAAALKGFDSAALAVLLQLRRDCLAAGRRFSVHGIPARLAKLARLYGIEELLPQA